MRFTRRIRSLALAATSGRARTASASRRPTGKPASRASFAVHVLLCELGSVSVTSVPRSGRALGAQLHLNTRTATASRRPKRTRRRALRGVRAPYLSAIAVRRSARINVPTAAGSLRGFCGLRVPNPGIVSRGSLFCYAFLSSRMKLHRTSSIIGAATGLLLLGFVLWAMHLLTVSPDARREAFCRDRLAYAR